MANRDHGAGRGDPGRDSLGGPSSQGGQGGSGRQGEQGQQGRQESRGPEPDADRPPSLRPFDLGDRNPSQGFTGGYGGAVSEDRYSYATSGDRLGGRRDDRRSDQRIEEELREALTRRPGLDATDVEVRVEQAVVILSGVVEDRHDRRLAGEIAEQVPGVAEVRNELHARRGMLASLFRGADADRSRTDRDVTPGAHRDAAAGGGPSGATPAGPSGAADTPDTSERSPRS